MNDGPTARARHVVNRLPVFTSRRSLRLATAGRQQSAQSGETVGDNDAVRYQFRQRFFNLATQQLRVLNYVCEERSAACLQVVVNHLGCRRKLILEAGGKRWKH